MNPGPTRSSVAVVIRGVSSYAAATVRGVKSTPAGVPFDVYLVLDSTAPAEALNRTAAVRTEDLILFLDAGLTPTNPYWLKKMADAVATVDVGVAIGTLTGEGGSTFAGMLTRRDVFDLLGGFDADRFARSGYLEDYLSRVIGLGYECVAPAEAVFLAGSPQLKRAG